MMRFVVLDSTPLSLVTQRRGVVLGDECKQWLARQTAQGVRVIVPEIVDYELRRELLRLDRKESIDRLDLFLSHPSTLYQPLTSRAIRLAANLWAQSRRQGTPTADPHALDIDVLLSAQVLAEGFLPADFVVATSNVGHLSQFVPAQLWQLI